MAIYHFNVKVVSRGKGASALQRRRTFRVRKSKTNMMAMTRLYQWKFPVMSKTTWCGIFAGNALSAVECVWILQFTIRAMTIHTSTFYLPHAELTKTALPKKNVRGMIRHCFWSGESCGRTCNHKLYYICDERIDHRSYKAQGVDKIPQVHLGAAACAIEKKGYRTDKGSRNSKIALKNLDMEIEQQKHSLKNIIKGRSSLGKDYLEALKLLKLSFLPSRRTRMMLRNLSAV